jgi:hypothetical protein
MQDGWRHRGDPLWTLPIGVPFRVDPRDRTFTQLEPAVADAEA